jgi:hypothetical protein
MMRTAGMVVTRSGIVLDANGEESETIEIDSKSAWQWNKGDKRDLVDILRGIQASESSYDSVD